MFIHGAAERGAPSLAGKARKEGGERVEGEREGGREGGRERAQGGDRLAADVNPEKDLRSDLT